MANKVTSKVKELFDDFYADGYVKLPLKYKGADVYEATYDKPVCIGRFPPYAIVEGEEVRLADETESEEIFDATP